MYLDTNGLIVMEQEGPPGCFGDACAETSRYVTLQNILGNKTNSNLTLLVTNTGVLRYPSPPGIWTESDCSDDQVMPLISTGVMINTIIEQLEDNGYKTGNGDLIHPTTYAQLRRSQDCSFQWLWDFTILFQALLFKLPFYYNDGKKDFESTSDDTADYLNFINFLAFAKLKNETWVCKLTKKIISSSTAFSKVQSYYSDEPNSEWLLDIYQDAIVKIWS
jgi:hypothetical protein